MAVETVNAHSGPFAGNGVTVAFPFTFSVMSGDGVTVAFPFTFSVMSGDDVTVISRASDGTDTTISSSSYTVALTSTAPSAGTVTFTTPPATGSSIYLLLDLDFTQETEFENGSPWLARPVNNANDRSALRDQVLKRDVARSLKAPLGETLSALPAATHRAGNMLGFDEFGDIALVDGLGALGLSTTSQALVTAGEAISAGAFVNIYTTGGNTRARKADASDPLKYANGFAPLGISNGAIGVIAAFGLNIAVSPSTSDEIWLSTAGAFTTTPPSVSGYLSQPLGLPIPGIGIFFIPQPRIVIP